MASINHTKLIAVEGKDEVNFFKALTNHLNIVGVQIEDFEGKTNFDNKIKAIVNVPGFRKVESFALIRDADNNPPLSAFESIRTSLIAANLPVPDNLNVFTNTYPSIGVFVMPGNSESGMLEDLCLKSIGNSYISNCIESYINCSDVQVSNLSKAKILCYLAVQKPLVNSLGLGALKGHWDFNSPVFDGIKTFLQQMK